MYISFICLFLHFAHFSVRLLFFLSICRSVKTFFEIMYSSPLFNSINSWPLYSPFTFTQCKDYFEANPQHRISFVNILVNKSKRSKLLKISTLSSHLKRKIILLYDQISSVHISSVSSYIFKNNYLNIIKYPVSV